MHRVNLLKLFMVREEREGEMVGVNEVFVVESIHVSLL